MLIKCTCACRQNKWAAVQNATKWDVANMVQELQGQWSLVLPKVRQLLDTK